MLVKFKSGNLEARFKMDAIPRKGDIISISDRSYEVIKIRWELEASRNNQVVVVQVEAFGQ